MRKFCEAPGGSRAWGGKIINSSPAGLVAISPPSFSSIREMMISTGSGVAPSLTTLIWPELLLVVLISSMTGLTLIALAGERAAIATGNVSRVITVKRPLKANIFVSIWLAGQAGRSFATHDTMLIYLDMFADFNDEKVRIRTAQESFMFRTVKFYC
jgi:hypothetical protein